MSEIERVTITICGDGGAGKSLMCLRMTGNPFTTEYDPTIEDSYSVTRNVDGTDYQIVLIDTAGQEEYRALWGGSSMQSDAFLLLYDLTNPDALDSMTYFSDMIDMEVDRRMFLDGELAPVTIVAGNKSDLRERRRINGKQGLEWARRHSAGFTETSAKDMINVEQTFSLLVRRVVKQRRMKGTRGKSPAWPSQPRPRQRPAPSKSRHAVSSSPQPVSGKERPVRFIPSKSTPAKSVHARPTPAKSTTPIFTSIQSTRTKSTPAKALPRRVTPNSITRAASAADRLVLNESSAVVCWSDSEDSNSSFSDFEKPSPSIIPQPKNSPPERTESHEDSSGWCASTFCCSFKKLPPTKPIDAHAEKPASQNTRGGAQQGGVSRRSKFCYFCREVPSAKMTTRPKKYDSDAESNDERQGNWCISTFCCSCKKVPSTKMNQESAMDWDDHDHDEKKTGFCVATFCCSCKKVPSTKMPAPKESVPRMKKIDAVKSKVATAERPSFKVLPKEKQHFEMKSSSKNKDSSQRRGTVTEKTKNLQDSCSQAFCCSCQKVPSTKMPPPRGSIPKSRQRVASKSKLPAGRLPSVKIPTMRQRSEAQASSKDKDPSLAHRSIADELDEIDKDQNSRGQAFHCSCKRVPGTRLPAMQKTPAKDSRDPMPVKVPTIARRTSRKRVSAKPLTVRRIGPSNFSLSFASSLESLKQTTPSTSFALAQAQVRSMASPREGPEMQRLTQGQLENTGPSPLSSSLPSSSTEDPSSQIPSFAKTPPKYAAQTQPDDAANRLSTPVPSSPTKSPSSRIISATNTPRELTASKATTPRDSSLVRSLSPEAPTPSTTIPALKTPSTRPRILRATTPSAHGAGPEPANISLPAASPSESLSLERPSPKKGQRKRSSPRVPSPSMSPLDIPSPRLQVSETPRGGSPFIAPTTEIRTSSVSRPRERPPNQQASRDQPHDGSPLISPTTNILTKGSLTMGTTRRTVAALAKSPSRIQSPTLNLSSEMPLKAEKEERIPSGKVTNTRSVRLAETEAEAPVVLQERGAATANLKWHPYATERVLLPAILRRSF